MRSAALIVTAAAAKSCSLESRTNSNFFSSAVVTPLLKKVSAVPQDFMHYTGRCPICVFFCFGVGLESGGQAADCLFGYQPTFAAVAVSLQTPPFYRF